MKKMTFLFVVPLLFSTTLVLCVNDIGTWAPHPQRARDQQQRIVVQTRMVGLQNPLKSPSPRQKRKWILPKRRQSPAHSVTR